MKQCPECGENLADDAVHCGHCGAQVEEGGEDNKETMFGVGALSDEDLEGIEEGGEGDDDDDFRLPSPGEMGGDDQDGEDRTDRGAEGAPDQGGGEGRPGLKGPSDEDDAAALAETEALPSLDEQEDRGREQEGSDLEEGRISSPGPESGEQEIGASPDLAGESSPAASGGSPFAGEDQQAQQVGGGGAHTGSSMTDSSPPEKQETGAGGDQSQPGHDLPDTADLEPEFEESHGLPSGGGASSQSGRDDQPAAGTPEQDAGTSQAGGGAGAGTPGQRTGGAGGGPPEQQEPGGAGGGEAEPDQHVASRDPMAEDSRFDSEQSGPRNQDQPPAGDVQGAGGLAQEQQPQSSAQSSSDENNTTLIIVAIVGAMFLVCALGTIAATLFL